MKTNGFGLKYGQALTDGLPVWKNWALVESMRRLEPCPSTSSIQHSNLYSTMNVLIIISSLFDVGVALSHMHCSDTLLQELPLPCTKKLWKAESELAWSLEYKRHLSTLGQQPTPIYLDLLLLEYGSEVLSARQRGILEEWLMELDEFGMMATSSAKYISETGLLYQGYGIST